MNPLLSRALVWIRRDLRAADHAALHHALRGAREVWCVFVFDRDILDSLPKSDRRVEFIHGAVQELDADLARLGAEHGHSGVRLLVRYGRATEIVPSLAQALKVSAVFANRDDDPAALRRDREVQAQLGARGIEWREHKDHVVFERDELLTAGGRPYTVFTPYRNAWLKKLRPFDFEPYAVSPHAASLAPVPASLAVGLPSLSEMGFETTNLRQLAMVPGRQGALAWLNDFLTRMPDYHQTRDYPALKGPSYLSTHLRFGTLSVREAVSAARRDDSEGARVWLSELIWRDFYHQILHHHPHVVTQCFRPSCDALVWEDGPAADALFDAWCEGRTGYPIVDAAQRQLLQTGYMHNRLRMISASFLVKDLGLDWRRGERHFAQHLNDFDLAANNGGWQWAASTGCDAQPWFRIFSPERQSQRFDPQGRFIRRYVPELGRLPDAALHAPWRVPEVCAAVGVVLGREYPQPIVDHERARVATLARFEAVRGGA